MVIEQQKDVHLVADEKQVKKGNLPLEKEGGLYSEEDQPDVNNYIVYILVLNGHFP